MLIIILLIGAGGFLYYIRDPCSVDSNPITVNCAIKILEKKKEDKNSGVDEINKMISDLKTKNVSFKKKTIGEFKKELEEVFK